MNDVVEVLEYVNLGLFVALGIMALMPQVRKAGRASIWVSATFLILAAVALAGRVLPDETEPLTDTEQLLVTVLVAILAFFPYSLYRFTSALGGRHRLLDPLALVLTAGIVIWSFILGDFPREGEPRPPEFDYYIIAFLVQWTTLLLGAAVRLWRWGRGQVPLVKNRMRVLAVGTIVLNVVILVAGSNTSEIDWVDVVTQTMTAGSAIAFFLAFAPPATLRNRWRRREAEELQQALEQIVSATSVEEISTGLLPRATHAVGAKGVVLLGEGGEVLASFPDGEVEADDDSETLRSGPLVVHSNPVAPFFGKEEFDLLSTLGTLAELALDRVKLNDREREARLALERSYADLAEAQAVAHIGSWEWDVSEDTVTWSDELLRIYGVAREEFEGTYDAFLDRVHPDDRPVLRSIIGEAFEKGTDFSFEHRIVRPDGEIRSLAARGRVISQSGAVVRMVGTGQDITEFKEAVAEQERLAQIVTSSGEAIYGMTLEGIVTSWNPGAEHILGYSAAEMIGGSIEAIIPETLLDQRVEMMRKVIKGEVVTLEQSQRMHKDGRILEIALTVAPIRDAVGRIVGASAVLRDMTALKERAELERRLLDIQTRQKQALELNDNVVQGLTVAKYALDLEDRERAAKALSDTLTAAKSIVSDLLRTPAGEALEPGDLVRTRAAGSPRKTDEEEA